MVSFLTPTEILKETNFRSVFFIYHSKCCFRLHSLLLNYQELWESRIVLLTSLKHSDFTTSENKKELEDSIKKIKGGEAKLRNLISDSQKQRKRRAEKKQVISELADSKIPANTAKLRKLMNKSPGRQIYI